MREHSALPSNKTLGKPDNERAAEINLEIGTDYLRKNNLGEARKKIASPSSRIRALRGADAAGVLYERARREQQSRSYFARACHARSEKSELQNNYSVFLCQKGKRERGEKLMIEAANQSVVSHAEVAYSERG